MLERIGNVIYWSSLLVSFFIMVFGVVDTEVYGPWVNYGGEASIDWETVFVCALVSIAVISFGWSMRYILSGRKGLKP